MATKPPVSTPSSPADAEAAEAVSVAAAVLADDVPALLPLSVVDADDAVVVAAVDAAAVVACAVDPADAEVSLSLAGSPPARAALPAVRIDPTKK